MEVVTQSAGSALGAATPAKSGPPAGLLGLPPLPTRAGHLPVADLVDLFMLHYAGRDDSKAARMAWWKARLGHMALQDVTDDDVHAAIEDYAGSANTYFAGRDARGEPIFKARKRPLRPATVNRMLNAGSGLFSWAIKRRIAPKGWVHPCRGIERRPEDNERTRFLSDAERTRLLEACRASEYGKLYLLVLMAVTTGARRSELLGLRWADIDLKHGTAALDETKNGKPRLLPLTPAVVEELTRFKAGSTSLIFGRPNDPTTAFSIDGPFRRALVVARVRDFTFHCLRHSCASTLAMSGASLVEVADLLGHKTLTTTKRYSHLSTGHKQGLVTRVFGDLR